MQTFARTAQYDPQLIQENMMGPNSMLILEEIISPPLNRACGYWIWVAAIASPPCF